MTDLYYCFQDVLCLQTHILQEYISEEIKRVYNDSTWKTEMYKDLLHYKENVKDDKSNVLSRMLDTIKSLPGKEEDIDIYKFDITYLKHMICKLKFIKFKIPDSIKSATLRLQEDRNMEDHRNYNESEEELFQIVMSASFSLENFILEVYNHSKLDNGYKEEFKKKYISTNIGIKEKTTQIYNTDNKIRGIVIDILKYRGTKDFSLKYYEAFNEIYIRCAKFNDMGEFHKFIIEAAKNKIFYAYDYLSFMYLRGDGVTKNLFKAEEYAIKSIKANENDNGNEIALETLIALYEKNNMESIKDERIVRLINEYKEKESKKAEKYKDVDLSALYNEYKKKAHNQ